jgi:hypothetical protein
MQNNTGAIIYIFQNNTLNYEGYHWYPIALTFDDKSMVFAEGTSTEDWKWSAVKSKDGKADMTTKSEFEERDFMEALDYVGYFNQK